MTKRAETFRAIAEKSKAERPFLSPGQLVRLRGRNLTGVIHRVNQRWVWVIWDDRGKGPIICHQFELEVLYG